jgi:hypothetical protein
MFPDQSARKLLTESFQFLLGSQGLRKITPFDETLQNRRCTLAKQAPLNDALRNTPNGYSKWRFSGD